LKNIVARNRVRQDLTIKQQSYDAWRQITEILLTSCPEDLMPREVRQTVLFELLHELLNKVSKVLIIDSSTPLICSPWPSEVIVINVCHHIHLLVGDFSI
jgi:hypothetical protein